MNAEWTISEIEWLERMFAEPDTRPLSASDLAAANRSHDEKLANSPWFRLWQRHGVCCREVDDEKASQEAATRSASPDHAPA
jgi:hypothetical protein